LDHYFLSVSSKTAQQVASNINSPVPNLLPFVAAESSAKARKTHSWRPAHCGSETILILIKMKPNKE